MHAQEELALGNSNILSTLFMLDEVTEFFIDKPESLVTRLEIVLQIKSQRFMKRHE